MRLFLLLLLLGSFAQTAFLPINLVLIFLITRSLVVEERSNYFGAFFIGVIMGVLTGQNLGIWPLIFLGVVKLINLLKKLPFSFNYKTLIPLAFLIYLTVSFLEKILFGQSINIIKVIFETGLTLPIYFFVKFWEERFIVKPDIKLKIKD